MQSTMLGVYVTIVMLCKGNMERVKERISSIFQIDVLEISSLLVAVAEEAMK